MFSSQFFLLLLYCVIVLDTDFSTVECKAEEHDNCKQTRIWYNRSSSREKMGKNSTKKLYYTKGKKKGSLTSGFSLIRVPLFVRSPFLSARKLQVCCCILWCESFSLYFLCFSSPAAAVVIDDRRLGMFMTEWISVDYRDDCQMVDLWWLLSVVDQFNVVAHSFLQSNHKNRSLTVGDQQPTTYSHFSLLCVLVFPLSCRAMKNLWKRNAILTWFHLSSFPCCLSSHWSVYWFLRMYTRSPYSMRPSREF